jgi:hypothetical protein
VKTVRISEKLTLTLGGLPVSVQRDLQAPVDPAHTSPKSNFFIRRHLRVVLFNGHGARSGLEYWSGNL